MSEKCGHVKGTKRGNCESCDWENEWKDTMQLVL